MTPISSDEFIEAVRGALADGYGFLPFIGAGFSAPSGVPIIVELEEYLQHCICLAVLPNQNWFLPLPKTRPWSPRTDRWPPFDHIHREPTASIEVTGHSQMNLTDHDSKPAISPVEVLLTCMTSLHDDVEKHRRTSNEIKASETGTQNDMLRFNERRLKLYSEAFGAMQDWRSSLFFLSRLVPSTESATDEPDIPRLTTPNPEVIDNCFRQVLEGRGPSLGHRMLASLAGALRIDLILTTNFDDLIERAFKAVRNDIQVFEVFVDKNLPKVSEIEGKRSLVKIHGGRLALRADYSLDDPPNETDQAHFLDYLVSEEGRRQIAHDHLQWTEAPDDRISPYYDPDKHLLMLGFSGGDERVNHLLVNALKRLKRPFTVYWLYYTDTDRRQIESRFGKFANVRLVHCTSLGLLLMELYQYLRKALPPGGGIFPSPSRLTVPPLTPDGTKQRLAVNPDYELFLESLRDAMLISEQEPKARIVVAHAAGEVAGLTSACGEIFREVETALHLRALWIDLDSVSNTDHLYEVILEAAYYRLGAEDWIASTSEQFVPTKDDYSSRADEFSRVIGGRGKRWLIFLNARQRPGASTLGDFLAGIPWTNGWLEEADGENSADFKSFLNLLKALAKAGGITFVIACSTSAGLLTKTSLWTKTEGIFVGSVIFGGVGRRAEILADCNEWVGKNLAQSKLRRKFIQTLSLIQRPCLPAALWSSAFYDESVTGKLILSHERMLKTWLSNLSEKPELIRFLPGGLIWIQVDHRLILQSDDHFNNQIASIHAGIAAWYERNINTTQSPDAVFECAYHYCLAAKNAIKERSTAVNSAEPSKEKLPASYLKAAYAVILTESYLIQTHGYSKGCCRQLSRLSELAKYILDSLSSEKMTMIEPDELSQIRRALFDLRLACTETMRAVAREVGEDGKAFLRHEQAGLLLLNLDFSEQNGRNADGGFGLVKQIWSCSHLSQCERWRWLRWTVMLHISTRAYQRAENLLHGTSESEKPGLLGKFIDTGDLNSSIVSFNVDSPREAIELLRIIEQAVALQLLRLSPDRRSMSNHVPDEKRLRFAEKLVSLGVRLASEIRMSGKLFAGSIVMETNWCEARLLMHQSVIQSHSEGSRTRSPLGILSDAESLLRISNPQRLTSEIALIDLHRAEVILNSSAFTPAVRVFHRLKTSGKLSASEAAKDKLTLKKTGPVAADAIRFLDRAESELRQMRRNVWWTTWYFERKLRAISFALLASCAEPSSQIPYLGLESAVAGSETVVDILYNDALRMIRVDTYRMATVLDAYHLCLIAFRHRLKDVETDNERIQLEARRDKMWNRMRDDADQLHKNHTNRQSYGDTDSNINKYISRVLSDIDGITYPYSAESSTSYMNSEV